MTSDAKIEAVLEAALALFAAQGFDGTAMPEVAARARVGIGTIYRYFPTKEGLGNAVFRRSKAALGTVMAEALGTPGDAETRFLAAWRGTLSFAGAHPLAFQFIELHHHAPYLDAESRALDAEANAAAMSFLARAQAEGAVETVLPAPMAAALLWGALVGLVKAASAGTVALDEGAIDHSGRLLWRALARQGGDR